MVLALLLFLALDLVEGALFPQAAEMPLRFVHLARGFLATSGGMLFVWWIMRRKETELTGLRDPFAEQLEKRTRELATANDNLLLEVERRKQVEERLKKAVKELSTSNDKLNQFAKIASHDLQEPLRVIEGYSDLLTRRYKGQLDVRGDDFIQQMVDATKRMQVLIQDILLHSQIQARSQPFQTTDLNQVLGEALLNLHKTVTESGAQITCDALPTLPADRLQLEQLFKTKSDRQCHQISRPGATKDSCVRQFQGHGVDFVGVR